jgi:hypothetical protein
MRTTTFLATLAVGLFAFTAAMAAPGSVLAKKFKGQIVASDQPLPMEGDEAAIAASLKKAQKTTIERSGTDPWTVHFVGFLSKKPGTDKVNLLVYNVASGKREYLTTKEITVDADATILASSVELTEDDGLKPGLKAELVLATFGAKQTDLAKVKLTFK